MDRSAEGVGSVSRFAFYVEHVASAFGARGSAGAVSLLLHGAYSSRRAQEHRADCSPPRAPSGPGGASIAAPFCRERRLVAGSLAAAGSNLCSACDREERQDKSPDRRRHGVPEEGRSFGRSRPPVSQDNSASRHNCQIEVSLSAANEHASLADRLSALPSRRLGSRSGSPGQSRRARGRRLQDQTANRARPDPRRPR